MLPNVRLMIAATLASVVALICGFGMFAVFRVNHEPFARLPAATAPLLLVADNAAIAPARYALAEPFDARFQLAVKRDAVEQISTTAAPADQNEQAEASTATATTTTEATTAAATDATSEETGGEKTEPAGALTASTAEPAPQPEAVEAVAAAAVTAAPQPEPDAASPIVSAPPATPAPSPAAEVAVNALAASELPLAPKLTDRVPQPTDNATPEKRTHKPTAQKAKRLRAAVHVPRAPRMTVLSYAQYPWIRYAASYAPIPEQQDFGTTQMAVRLVRPSIAARRLKEPNTAVGGPFVSATSR
jgi:hypothetical protein